MQNSMVNADLRETRVVSKPDYRVIYNQDDSVLFFETSYAKERMTPQHVDRMVDEVADGGADVFLTCVNAQKVNYPSKVWERYWDDEEANKAHTELIRGMIGSMQELAGQCDYLERAVSRCRQRGIVPGASIRMNDMHGFPQWPNAPSFSRFYKDHRAWQLESDRSRGYASRALDYEVPEVREHYMSLIREVANDYNVELIELDFTRFPVYFDRDNIDQHCATMTTFLAEIREVLNSTGRTIAFVPRIAAWLGGAKGLGFDVEAWAQRGIVDGITIAEFLSTGWEMPIAKFRHRVGPDVAIFAAGECTAVEPEGLSRQYLPTDRELLRGFASAYLASGADGVYLFNFFAVHHPWGGREMIPLFDAFSELKDLAALRAKPRRHVTTHVFDMVEINLPLQVPVDLKPNQSRAFHMLLAAEDGALDVRALITVDRMVNTKDLWLYVNDEPIGCAAEIVEGELGRFRSHVAVFNLPHGIVRDGANELVVRCEYTLIKIVGLEVRFGEARS